MNKLDRLNDSLIFHADASRKMRTLAASLQKARYQISTGGLTVIFDQSYRTALTDLDATMQVLLDMRNLLDGKNE